MTYPFNDAFRREVASRCAAFPRLPASDATRALKHAAVAITLTQTQDGSGETAFLMTRRTHRLRAHGGQWALPGGRRDAGETPIEAALRELAARLELSPRKAFQPIRIAVTGSKVSPGLFESLELLGKEESLSYIAANSGFGEANGSSAR